MELSVVSKNKDKYFKRELVNFTIKTNPKETIKVDDVKRKLAEEFKEGFLVVSTMKNVYGKREIKGMAEVYADEASAKKILQKYVLKKNGVVYAERKEQGQKEAK